MRERHTAITNTFSKKSSRGFSNNKDSWTKVPISTPTKTDKKGQPSAEGGTKRVTE